MTNFVFLKAVGWPAIHADCARAESYLGSDPRSACFYARRAPTGPDTVFGESDVDNIVEILNTVKANAAPAGGAA